jgi:hypothetical protein
MVYRYALRTTCVCCGRIHGLRCTPTLSLPPSTPLQCLRACKLGYEPQYTRVLTSLPVCHTMVPYGVPNTSSDDDENRHNWIPSFGAAAAVQPASTLESSSRTCSSSTYVRTVERRKVGSRTVCHRSNLRNHAGEGAVPKFAVAVGVDRSSLASTGSVAAGEAMPGHQCL